MWNSFSRVSSFVHICHNHQMYSIYQSDWIQYALVSGIMIEFYVPTWYRVSSVPIIVPGTQNRSNVPGTHPVHIIVPGTQYTSLYVVSGIISTHNCTQYPSIIIPPGIGHHQQPSLYLYQVPIIVPGIGYDQYRSLYLVLGIFSTHQCSQFHQPKWGGEPVYHQCTWTKYPSLYQVPTTHHCTWYRGLQSCARVGQGSPSPHCHQCKKSSGSLAEKLMSRNIHRNDTGMTMTMTQEWHNIHRNDNDNDKYLHKDQCHQCKKASGSFAEKIYI